jgi:hypothetical protein
LRPIYKGKKEMCEQAPPPSPVGSGILENRVKHFDRLSTNGRLLTKALVTIETDEENAHPEP